MSHPTEDVSLTEFGKKKKTKQKKRRSNLHCAGFHAEPVWILIAVGFCRVVDRQLRVSICASHPHFLPSSSKLIPAAVADGAGASAALPPAAPAVMNDCMVLGIKLDQCNPAQHMQQPARAKSSRQ